MGDDHEPYRERFEIKSKDKKKSWDALINLCRVLNETPSDQREEALKPILDIDGVLWFLAIDVVSANSDGYWTRASDYNIYLDPEGVFHILPHDMNEAFRVRRQRGGGRKGGKGGKGGKGKKGRNGRPGGSGHELDPLLGLDSDRMPLRSQLLSIPSIQERYLKHVRTLATRHAVEKHRTTADRDPRPYR